MAAIQQEILFTLSIPAHKSPAAPSPGGKITVSKIIIQNSASNASDPDPKAASSISSHPAAGKPRPRHGDAPPPPPIYLLTYHSPPDNRLSIPFVTTYLHALLKLQYSSYPYGLLLTTSSIPKFFSNGLDLATFDAAAKKAVYTLWRKLLTYPMPTCAVVNGHAFAGGLMTAMFHDYRIMNPHRGWLCLNELEFDAELGPPMAEVFKVKVSNAVFRSLILEAKRFTPLQALEAGLVDGLGGLEDAVKVMTDVEGGYGRGAMVVGIRGKGTVYGKLKEEILRNVLAALDQGEQGEAEMWEGRYADRKRREEEEKATLARLEGHGKAKL